MTRGSVRTPRRAHSAVRWQAVPALRLYESVGFVVEGRRPGHLRLRGREEDLILMGLALR